MTLIQIEFALYSCWLAHIAIFNSNTPLEITFQGYQGLVDGGDNIKLAHWQSVTNIIQLVG